MRHENDLRITIRCMTEDLQEDAEDLGPQNSDHILARAFAEMRAQLPVGQQTVNDLATNKPVFTLHGGRWRGATWHDEAELVVWLLAARFHTSGDPEDAYPYFRELDADGNLLPTSEDYALLHKARAARVFQQLAVEIDDLASQARNSPNSELRGTIAGTFSVALLYEKDDAALAFWVIVSQRIEESGELDPPADWMQMLLARFFPGATFLDLVDGGNYPLRELGDDELAFCQIEIPT